MSNENFQDRLQRIGTKPPQQQPMSRGKSPSGRSGKLTPNHGLLAVGSLIMSAGIMAIRYVNSNYETIRDSNGIEVAIGGGVAAFLAILIGAMVSLRALGKKHGMTAADSAFQHSNNTAKPSTKAKVFFSLLGFAFGAIAIFYLFAAGGAVIIETETARNWAGRALAISLFLAILSLSFGCVGLFLRGYALLRVPGYFVLGAVLTYAIVHLFKVNVPALLQLSTILQ